VDEVAAAAGAQLEQDWPTFAGVGQQPGGFHTAGGLVPVQRHRPGPGGFGVGAVVVLAEPFGLHRCRPGGVAGFPDHGGGGPW
jgi:hypothetical protein